MIYIVDVGNSRFFDLPRTSQVPGSGTRSRDWTTNEMGLIRRKSKRAKVMT